MACILKYMACIFYYKPCGKNRIATEVKKHGNAGRIFAV